MFSGVIEEKYRPEKNGSIAIFQKQLMEMFYKKAFLKTFAIFTGKHLSWSLFLIKFM